MRWLARVIFVALAAGAAWGAIGLVTTWDHFFFGGVSGFIVLTLRLAALGCVGAILGLAARDLPGRAGPWFAAGSGFLPRLCLYGVCLGLALSSMVPVGRNPVHQEALASSAFHSALLLGGGLPLLLASLLPGMVRAGSLWPVRLLDLLLFNLVLFILLLEGSLLAGQALYPGYELWDDAPDAMRVTLMRGEESSPDFRYRWNSRGFHDDESFVAREGDHVVALIADSFGVGVVPHAYNFATVAERRLQQRLRGAVPGRVAVHNLGVTRIDMPGYAYLLRTEARRLRPTQVVLCVFVGNDLVGLEAPPEPGVLEQHRRLEGWLVWRVPSRAYQISEALAERDPMVGDPPGGARRLAFLRDPSLERPFYREDRYMEIERSRLELLDPMNPENHHRYELFLSGLDHFRRELGDRLLVLLIPDELQVNDALWRELGGPDGAATTILQRDYPQRQIASWCRKNSVRLLDMLPLLREAEKQGRTYHLRDTHWNANGNRVAGEALGEALARWALSAKQGR